MFFVHRRIYIYIICNENHDDYYKRAINIAIYPLLLIIFIYNYIESSRVIKLFDNINDAYYY